MCERCETAPAVSTFRARLRRLRGGRPAWSLPVRMCAPCAATVARLLGPGHLLVAVG
jgi:hypothetical protein